MQARKPRPQVPVQLAANLSTRRALLRFMGGRDEAINRMLVHLELQRPSGARKPISMAEGEALSPGTRAFVWGTIRQVKNIIPPGYFIAKRVATLLAGGIAVAGAITTAVCFTDLPKNPKEILPVSLTMLSVGIFTLVSKYILDGFYELLRVNKFLK